MNHCTQTWSSDHTVLKDRPRCFFPKAIFSTSRSWRGMSGSDFTATSVWTFFKRSDNVAMAANTEITGRGRRRTRVGLLVQIAFGSTLMFLHDIPCYFQFPGMITWNIMIFIIYGMTRDCGFIIARFCDQRQLLLKGPWFWLDTDNSVREVVTRHQLRLQARMMVGFKWRPHMRQQLIDVKQE